MNNKKIIAKPKVGSLQLHAATDIAQLFCIEQKYKVIKYYQLSW